MKIIGIELCKKNFLKSPLFPHGSTKRTEKNAN